MTLITPKYCPNCGGVDISYLWYTSFFCHDCDTEIDTEIKDERPT